MIAAAIQRSFPFADHREKRRLARLETVMDELEANEDKVLLLVLDGELVGFNLAGANASRRLLAVWWTSIRNYVQRRDVGQVEVYKPVKHETAEVIADILPPGSRDLRFSELKLALGVKSQHLHNLIDDQLLAKVPGTGNAVNQAPMITRASVVSFLEERRVR